MTNGPGSTGAARVRRGRCRRLAVERERLAAVPGAGRSVSGWADDVADEPHRPVRQKSVQPVAVCSAVRSGKWKLKLPSTLKDETYYTTLETPDAKIPRALYDLAASPSRVTPSRAM